MSTAVALSPGFHCHLRWYVPWSEGLRHLFLLLPFWLFWSSHCSSLTVFSICFWWWKWTTCSCLRSVVAGDPIPSGMLQKKRYVEIATHPPDGKSQRTVGCCVCVCQCDFSPNSCFSLQEIPKFSVRYRAILWLIQSPSTQTAHQQPSTLINTNHQHSLVISTQTPIEPFLFALHLNNFIVPSSLSDVGWNQIWLKLLKTEIFTEMFPSNLCSVVCQLRSIRINVLILVQPTHSDLCQKRWIYLAMNTNSIHFSTNCEKIWSGKIAHLILVELL